MEVHSASASTPLVAGLTRSTYSTVSRARRFGAFLIDHAFLIVPSGTAILIGIVPGMVEGSTNVGSSAMIGFIFAGILALGVLAFQAHGIVTRGQTLGKRIFKLRVAKADGRPVDFASGVVLRWLVPYLLFAMTFVGTLAWIVNALFIFRDDRRCVHDLIAKTQVVNA
jgi:uncharacterized RDD family membrane protein YckC